MSLGARDDRRIPADFEEDPRYRVSVREARIVIAYWVVFTVVVTAIAWGLGGNRSADEITFVLGMPAWFFWSGVVASFVLSLVPMFLVPSMFKEVPLGVDPDAPPSVDGAEAAPDARPGERG
jgi:uncharacterized membrane protein YhdT